MAKLDRMQVEHVARLARLPISSQELSKFSGQLSEITEYVGKIAEIKIQKLNIKNTYQRSKIARKDETKGECLTQEEATSNAKNVHNGLFMVEAIFEE